MLIYVLSAESDFAELRRLGHVPVSAQHPSDAPAILRRCDAFVFRREYLKADTQRLLSLAEALVLPITCLDEEAAPGLTPTEIRCPLQCEGFISAVMRMYRLHLIKNADYSPANILATGEIGLITRLWDKIARLLSLYGFDFTVIPGSYKGRRQPKNESIDDSLQDAAVYAVIGLLLRLGKWGQ